MFAQKLSLKCREIWFWLLFRPVKADISPGRTSRGFLHRLSIAFLTQFSSGCGKVK
jgi:hypothetical protein